MQSQRIIDNIASDTLNKYISKKKSWVDAC